VSYGLSFASITATLTHALLYFRKQIWVQSRRAMAEQPDIHARLMARYPQVPDWWYLAIFGEFSQVGSCNSVYFNSSIVSMFIFGVVSIEVWHTQLPVWAFVLALLIGMNIFSISFLTLLIIRCTLIA
jgi:OPT oligopeptide transporter protein